MNECEHIWTNMNGYVIWTSINEYEQMWTNMNDYDCDYDCVFLNPVRLCTLYICLTGLVLDPSTWQQKNLTPPFVMPIRGNTKGYCINVWMYMDVYRISAWNTYTSVYWNFTLMYCAEYERMWTNMNECEQIWTNMNGYVIWTNMRRPLYNSTSLGESLAKAFPSG